MVNDRQGTGRWVLHKLGIYLDGSIRAASSLSAPNIQTTLGMLVTVGDADNPPDFFQSTAAACGAGGSPSEMKERAERDMCAEVAEYLWRFFDRGKRKVAEGYLTFPSISFSASGVAAAAEGHRERDDEGPERHERLASGVGCPQAHSRGHAEPHQRVGWNGGAHRVRGC